LLCSDSGLTATVYYAIEVKTQREVAVKVIPQQMLALSKTLMREITILRSLHHPNIVELYDVFLSENEDLYIVMELYAVVLVVCGQGLQVVCAHH
jgi:serine/threonine protein kinase